MSALIRIAAFLAAAALAPAALAAEASMDKADVVWMLVSTTLVLFMTIPGIALFYGGMARKKNVLSILAQTTVICCALTLVWFAAGYSLAFGPGSVFVGGLSHVFLNGLDINSMSGSIPTLLFVCFQMTFAILTATLMIGAFAGRMKFSAMLVFMVLWSLCVYSPVCHWVWAEGGFFFDMGALDYAGGTVVHINAGVSGLVACLVLGKRLGYGREPMSPHNLTFAMLGAAILWIGWFGFNGGSGLAANERAVMAILVTQIAAAAAGVSWMLVEWMLRGRPSLLGCGLPQAHGGLGRLARCIRRAWRGRHRRRPPHRRLRLERRHGLRNESRHDPGRHPGRKRRRHDGLRKRRELDPPQDHRRRHGPARHVRRRTHGSRPLAPR